MNSQSLRGRLLQISGMAALAALIVVNLAAQDTRARINGRVVDSSGAVIPNVTIRLANRNTGGTQTADSNSEGLYAFRFLDPGDYQLAATSKGFKSYVRDSIILESGQVAGIEIRLELGEIAETVEIMGNFAVLDSESASRGLVVDRKLVQELPLKARNPLLLANSLPGVTFRGAGVFPQPFANGAVVNFTISGGSPAQNELLIDGAPNTARAAGNQNNIALIPVADSVGEVAIVTNAYDASYGRTSGGVINISTRGGTNQQHATGWGYLRRGGWNANLFPLNAIGSGRPLQQVNQYGVQVDGPVVIPKLLGRNGRLKMFYLAAWEHYDELTPNPLRGSVPTAEMRNGDFSRLTNANGDLIKIYDPATGRTDANGAFIRDSFAGNIIPASRISPVAVAVTRYFPNPNDPGLPRQRYAQGNFNLPGYSYPQTFWTFNGRIDVHAGDNDRLFVRSSPNQNNQNRSTNGLFGTPGEQAFNPFLRQNRSYLLDWVRVFNSTTVFNLRANYSRYVEGSGSDGNFGFNLASLGFPSSLPSQLAAPDFFGIYTTFNYSQLGSSVSYEYNNTYSLLATVAKTWRTHNFHAGTDIRRIQYLTTILGNPLQITNDASYTREVWNNAASEVNSGDSFASFLLGAPSGGTADYNVRPFYRSWYVSPYMQDDWKVTPRLALNLGLRWDYNTTPSEKYDRLATGFDTSSQSPIRQQPSAASLALYPNLNSLAGGLTFANVNDNRGTAGHTYFNTLQPRVGVAYRLGDRMVLRGGYGMFFANWPTGDFFQNQGFSASSPLVASGDGGRTPIPGILSNPFPGGVQKPTGSAFGLSTFAGKDFGWWNADAKLPRVNQFSLGMQLRAGSSSSLDISYVGSRTQDLITTKSLNIPSDAFIATCDPARGGNPTNCNALQANPFLGLPAFAGTALGTVQLSARSMSDNLRHSPLEIVGPRNEIKDW